MSEPEFASSRPGGIAWFTHTGEFLGEGRDARVPCCSVYVALNAVQALEWETDLRNGRSPDAGDLPEFVLSGAGLDVVTGRLDAPDGKRPTQEEFVRVVRIAQSSALQSPGRREAGPA